MLQIYYDLYIYISPYIEVLNLNEGRISGRGNILSVKHFCTPYKVYCIHLLMPSKATWPNDEYSH